MPGILFRHIFAELVKVLVVTTSVLVTVIAFGAAIKPLSENLLGPLDLLRFIAFATIPMMQFALPFAAAFAGTIVYHRLTTDNEITAMAASGIPYRRVMMPAVALGVLLTGAMVVLVDVGVPTFWQAMKRITATDGTRLLAAQVERGEAWTPKFSDFEIYADDAVLVPAPADTGADNRLILLGVAAMQVDGELAPIVEFTAESATIDVHRIDDNTFLKPVLSNATVFHRGDQRLAHASIVRPEAIDLGQTFEGGPKGLTFRQLLALRDDPARFPPVARIRGELESALDAVDAWQALGRGATARTPLVFRAAGDGGRNEYEVTGAYLVGSELRSDGGVSIRHFQRIESGRDPGRALIREITTQSIAVETSPGETRPDGSMGPRRFELSADAATVRDQRAGGRPMQRPLRLIDLELVGFERSDRSARSIDELVVDARAVVAGGGVGPWLDLAGRVDAVAEHLENRVVDLRDEIVARTVQRIAQAMTAILMLLSGCILAVLLRHKPPLFVYLFAFLPAIIDIVLISGGEQMLRRETTILGIAVAFSGNALLLLVCLFGAWRVGRH
jgi:lipopolysaccharide export LptBFGC system permease protein LptF